VRPAAPAVLFALGAAAAARGDELRSPSDLDGIYLTLGPVGAASRVADSWYSAVGGELSIVDVVEHRFPAALGVSGGGVSYAGRAGGRLWLEAESGISRPLPMGLGIGVAAEVDRVRPPRLGPEATLWIYWGIVPYVRIGTVRETGSFVEAGLMLKIPARRFP
jgi:hypothetical protein